MEVARKTVKVTEIERMYEGYLEGEEKALAGGEELGEVTSFQQFVVDYMAEEGAQAIELDGPMGGLWGTSSGEEALDAYLMQKKAAPRLFGAADGHCSAT